MNLNEQQLKAIYESIDCNTLVLAGPGSGKTATLTSRAEYLIGELNVDKENVLIITFTVKAANELKERMKNKVGNVDGLTIGTFHSICLKILLKFKDKLNFKHINIIDDETAYELMFDAAIERDMMCDYPDIHNYRMEIGIIKSLLLSPNDALNTTTDYPEYNIAKLYESYQKKLKENSFIDFDDIMLYTVSLIKSDEEVRNYCIEKFKYIMCDEVQDCNFVQFEFLKEISKGNNIFLVGDFGQSIYGFRGSNPKYMNNFESTFPNAKIIELAQNYRSTEVIVGACNDIINSGKTTFKKNCYTENEYGWPLMFKECTNEEDEINFVVSKIEYLINKKNKEYKDICILYRNNVQAEIVKKILKKNNIPYNIKGNINFYAKEEIKKLITLLSFFINDKNIILSKRLFRIIPGISKVDVKKILEKSKRLKMTPLQTARLCKPNNNAIYDLYRLFNRKNNLTIDSLISLLSEYMFRYLYLNTPEEEEKKIIVAFMNMSKNIIKDNDIKDLSGFVNYINTNKPVPNVEKTNKVNLATIHASKGLEYDTVFLIGASDKIFSSKERLNGEENRRLFYVAISRAEYRVYISYYKNCENHNKSSNKATEFIDDISNEFIAYLDETW